MYSSCMKIDITITFCYDFIHQGVCQTGCKRPFRASGKGSVEVSPVRKVTRKISEPENVYHRHGNKGSMNVSSGRRFKQPSYNFYPIYLVSVNRSRNKNTGSWFFTPDDMNLNIHSGLSVKLCYRKFYKFSLSKSDLNTCNFKRFGHNYFLLSPCTQSNTYILDILPYN
ncbi:hypothetical protein SDC9_166614 [bioreactor metagenome]|uniref:Uncharacterized protein n=1 Tax=bioreactor metagenome TaxID=1076179 RepID=A0A645FXJ7_9ZZZZ